jgi:hypothetical protein
MIFLGAGFIELDSTSIFSTSLGPARAAGALITVIMTSEKHQRQALNVDAGQALDASGRNELG